jgi:Lipoprotein amino terminal region
LQKYNSVPLMSSKVECLVVVDHNVVSEVECDESHLFQPFSNHERGAKTEVRQKMVLLEEANATVPLPDQVAFRTSLVFDHLQTPKPSSSEIKTSRDLLKKLCQMSSVRKNNFF